MTDIRADAMLIVRDSDAPDSMPPSFDIPSNKYADIFGLWPAELFEGFEEFVRKSRERSAERREPPPWW